MARIKGIIFDIDGTLLDSNDAHAQAWVDIFTMHDFDEPYTQVRSLIGMGADKLMPAAIRVENDSPLGKEISLERRNWFRKHYLPSLLPFRGARELLVRLHDDGIKVIVATSSNAEEAELFLNIIGAFQLVDVLETLDDHTPSKPSPNIVQDALAKSGLQASEVLMVGDTPYDIEAAAKAEVRTLAVTCGGWDAEHLRGALAIYEGPAYLLEHFDQLVEPSVQHAENTPAVV